jgi:hypothetical protein
MKANSILIHFAFTLLALLCLAFAVPTLDERTDLELGRTFGTYPQTLSMEQSLLYQSAFGEIGMAGYATILLVGK